MLLAAMFGLTWAVVAALKDTQIGNSGYMYVKGSNSELVKVCTVAVGPCKGARVHADLHPGVCAQMRMHVQSSACAHAHGDQHLKVPLSQLLCSPAGGQR